MAAASASHQHVDRPSCSSTGRIICHHPVRRHTDRATQEEDPHNDTRATQEEEPHNDTGARSLKGLLPPLDALPGWLQPHGCTVQTAVAMRPETTTPVIS